VAEVGSEFKVLPRLAALGPFIGAAAQLVLVLPAVADHWQSRVRLTIRRGDFKLGSLRVTLSRRVRVE
jgi:hypothetical protein